MLSHHIFQQLEEVKGASRMKENVERLSIIELVNIHEVPGRFRLSYRVLV